MKHQHHHQQGTDDTGALLWAAPVYDKMLYDNDETNFDNYEKYYVTR